MVPTFQPKIQLTLKKVQRRRGASRISFLSESQIQDIDLTPHLGETGSVTTSRAINQPAGTFTIVLADKLDSQSQDTLYASIEPMDLIYIRFARQPTGELPIVMRGLVSAVSRDETMGNDGHPHRTVTITGHDFGKFLQIMQISYLKEYIYGNYLLTNVPMYEAYGLWFGSSSPSDFVQKIMESLVSGSGLGGKKNTPVPFLKALFDKSGLDAWIEFGVDATVKGARVGPFGMTSQEGDVWQLMAAWCDLGWNEMFVEDRPDAAYLVYRPVPYHALMPDATLGAVSDTLIMAEDGAVEPAEVQVDVVEVEALSLSRSDSNVANFFQVDAPMAEIVNPDWIRVQATQNGLALETGNRNCAPEIYGLKKMNARTNQSAETGTDMRNQVPAAIKPAQLSAIGAWYQKRLRQLRAINEDNVVFEEGSMSMRGNEAIRPGVYIRLKRGSRSSRFYVTAVSHQFTPYHSFKTTLQLTRGESYIDRLNENGSPFIAEGKAGPYG